MAPKAYRINENNQHTEDSCEHCRRARDPIYAALKRKERQEKSFFEKYVIPFTIISILAGSAMTMNYYLTQQSQREKESVIESRINH